MSFYSVAASRIKVADVIFGAVGLSGAAGGQVKEEACGIAGHAKVAHQFKSRSCV